MKPYYDVNGITIYHGDCREVMPQIGKVDLLITDPPYGINYQSNHRNTKHLRIEGDHQLPLDAISDAIYKADKAAYVFCRWDMFSQMPLPTSFLVWVKNNWSMGDLLHEHGRQWEGICFYPKINHKFIKRIPDCINADRTFNHNHPTEKPSGLLQLLIESNEGDIVLDPFMGSGSTLRAAKDAGRKAIGIEIEERYCEAAVKKLAQEVLF